MRSCHQCGIRYAPEDAFCHEDGSALVTSDDQLLGAMVGSYRVVRLLGEGGMGRVYLGLHPQIGSRVAIKILLPLASTDDDLVQRFFAEARLVNKIRHEGIVNVLDLDHLDDGRPFIIMEYLEGEPLKTIIARGPMALGTAASIGVDILESLAAAHRVGVVHRDLKPDNIIITPKGRVKLLDFGIAKLLPGFETSVRGPMTRTDSLLGTPGYMAPEQVLGDAVTEATDVYAVGAVLYEALTGSAAFGGSTLFELLRQIVSDEPASPVERRPELAGLFEAFLLRALAKDPAGRFASAEAMAAELDAIRQGLGPQAWERLPPAPRSSSIDGTEDTVASINRQELVKGTDPTMLGSDAGSRSLGMAAPRRAPEALPPVLEIDPSASSTHDTAGRNTVYPVARKFRRKHTPWMAGVAVLGLGGALTGLMLSSQNRSNASRASAAVSRDASTRAPTSDGGLVAPRRHGDVHESLDAGEMVIAKLSEPHEETGAPGGRSRGRKSTKRGVPSSVPRVPVPRPPAKPASQDDSGVKMSGVTLIENGNRHESKTIHRAPDFAVQAFDPVAYLPKARKLAKQMYSDATLTEFDAEGVGANGKSNLSLARFEAEYRFLSRSHAKRSLPIGVEEDRPCWIYVEVDKTGVTARIVEWHDCKDRTPPKPKCSMKDIWSRSDVLGTPAKKAGAVAHITYMSDGEWYFVIDALNIKGSIPDDC